MMLGKRPRRGMAPVDEFDLQAAANYHGFPARALQRRIRDRVIACRRDGRKNAFFIEKHRDIATIRAMPAAAPTNAFFCGLWDGVPAWVQWDDTAPLSGYRLQLRLGAPGGSWQAWRDFGGMRRAWRKLLSAEPSLLRRPAPWRRHFALRVFRLDPLRLPPSIRCPRVRSHRAAHDPSRAGVAEFHPPEAALCPHMKALLNPGDNTRAGVFGRNGA